MGKLLIISNVSASNGGRHYVVESLEDVRNVVIVEDIFIFAGVRLICDTFSEAEKFVAGAFSNTENSGGTKS